MDGLKFEWDAVKRGLNLAKHGVSFEEASSVFYDEAALLIDDPEHSLDEARFVMLGMSQKARILVVCHCYRDGEAVIRIISARKATRGEMEMYVARGEA